MKNFEEFVKDIERDLVINITLSLRHGRIKKSEAKELAKNFISITYANYEELLGRLYFLSNSHEEVRKVFVKYAPNYYREKDMEKLNNMRNFMNIGDLDSAVLAGKGGSYGR